MYRIWFKIIGIDGEHSVDCANIAAAQIAYDTLNDNPLVRMICTRP